MQMALSLAYLINRNLKRHGSPAEKFTTTHLRLKQIIEHNPKLSNVFAVKARCGVENYI